MYTRYSRCPVSVRQATAAISSNSDRKNLLGVVKHLIGIEAGYLGVCLGQPFERPLPWIADESAWPNRDMWATADESREYIVELYQQACAHSDAMLLGSGWRRQ